jgi:hypothetical protein
LISYSDETLARLAAGEVDVIDAIELYLDEGTVAFCPGIVGQFTYDGISYVGARGLLTLDLPDQQMGGQSQPITATFAETYVPPNSDEPVNVFDDGVRASMDDITWQNRVAIPAVFWLDENGTILDREQVDVMQIDGMTQQADASGRMLRVGTLERPDIIQQDIEAKTADPAFQKLIDANDLGLSQAASTVTQTIYFGQATPKTAG